MDASPGPGGAPAAGPGGAPAAGPCADGMGARGPEDLGGTAPEIGTVCIFICELEAAKQNGVATNVCGMQLGKVFFVSFLKYTDVY